VTFRRAAFIIFALLAVANYFPLLFGLVPFPAHLLAPFPAWGGSSTWPPIPEIGDLITSFYPFHAFAARAVHEGSLPLWNPHILAGAPFLANAQSALLYPPNFLYYLLPVPVAWAVCLFIRMFACALFMTLFVRSIGGTKTGSIVSGIVYSSCGFMTAWQGQALGDAAIWLPLICYSIVRLRGYPSKRNIVLTAFAFAMPILAGHPETTAHSALVGSALVAVLWNTDRRFLRYFATAAVLAIGLAAVQIFPTVEWLRELGNQFETPWPTLGVHQAQGLFSRDILSSPNSAGISIPEGAAYLGMLTLLAASLAPLHRSRRYVVFLIAVSVVAMMIAYTIPPVSWIVAHAPYLKSMKNGRFIFVASFGIAAMAGLGISVLQERETALIGRKRKYAWSLLGVAFAAIIVAISRLQLATPIEATLMRRPSFSVLLACAALAILACALSGRMKKPLVEAFILSFLVFDLVTFSYGFTGFSSTRSIYTAAPVFDFLSKNADASQVRVAQVGNSYSANAAMMYGFAGADGYEVCLERPRRFAAGLGQDRQDGIFLVADGIVNATDRRLDMLNVKYLVVPAGSPEFQKFSEHPDRFAAVFGDDHVSVFENRRVLPRAFLVSASEAEVIPAPDAELSRLKEPSFDPERTVILSEPLPKPEYEEPTTLSTQDDVVMEQAGINEYRFRIKSSAKSLLVVSQIYYPGWRATVSGERVPVVPANYALTGIPVPAGDHEVRFVFDPASFKIGLATTILSILMAVALTLADLAESRL
jgi:Bacterial membrane protein YfhO